MLILANPEDQSSDASSNASESDEENRNAVPSSKADWLRLAADKIIRDLPKQEIDWSGLFDEPAAISPLRERLRSDLEVLRSTVDEQSLEISKLQAGSREHERKRNEILGNLNEFRQKSRLQHLLKRIHPNAADRVLADASFQKEFESSNTVSAFIISLDIRRSTELMLKAKRPEDFATFITELCDELASVILESCGVFDKFTGDGILAFFPEFYSGTDAAYFALEAASKCHLVFEKHYKAKRKCFTSILCDVGLGIGIDFGEVKLVQMRGELTVVGNPVVYACRMGGANAGDTLLNQPAYEKVFDGYSEFFNFEESSISLKHEGKVLAYRVTRNEKSKLATYPKWHSKHQLKSS